MDQFLTDKEFDIIVDSDFLLTKAGIIQKIVGKFDELRIKMIDQVGKSNFMGPENVDIKEGKVFRGENYKNLPYVVLDYPKHFSQRSVFAVRTMFWWGNFFSITLHLQGEDLDNLRGVLVEKENNLREKDIWFCCNSTPWEYRYKEDNYTMLDSLDPDELKSQFRKKEFIKLSRKIDLTDYGTLEAFCLESLALYLNVIAKPQ